MQPITKREMDLLIQKGILKHTKGSYREDYIPGSKGKHGKSKARWVRDAVYFKLYPKLDPNYKEPKQEKVENKQ